MRESAYTTWNGAETIFSLSGGLQLIPQNLQPKARPVSKRAAELVREYPPPDTSQEELDRLVDAIEAPWGNRVEKQIREAMTDLTGREATVRLVETVRRLGLQPFKAPEPLPPNPP
jgi:hypothetical protein